MPSLSVEPSPPGTFEADGFSWLNQEFPDVKGVDDDANQVIGANSFIGIIPFQGYSRFELDIPAGSTIDGVSYKLVSTGEGFAGPTGSHLESIGILKPDGVWETPAAFAGYSTGQYPPYPYYYAAGEFQDDTIFYLDRPETRDMRVETFIPLLESCAFEAGDVTGLPPATASYDASPLHTSLQGYLADYESLRGTGVGPGIPLALTVYPTAPVGGPWLEWGFCPYFSADKDPPSVRPRLSINYTEPSGTTAVSVIETSAAVRSEGRIAENVDSDIEVIDAARTGVEVK